MSQSHDRELVCATNDVWGKLDPDKIDQDGRYNLTIKLPPETIIQLNLLTRRRGVSMTTAVEQAVENEFKSDNRWPNRLRRWAVRKLTPPPHPKR